MSLADYFVAQLQVVAGSAIYGSLGALMLRLATSIYNKLSAGADEVQRVVEPSFRKAFLVATAAAICSGSIAILLTYLLFGDQPPHDANGIIVQLLIAPAALFAGFVTGLIAIWQVFPTTPARAAKIALCQLALVIFVILIFIGGTVIAINVLRL